MQILEKIITCVSENDTCTDDDEDDSNISRLIRRNTKTKKEKKKMNEVDWIKVRQLNQIIRRRLEHAKYELELQNKIVNESHETGTSNILDAIRDELTTDNDQGGVRGGGLSSQLAASLAGIGADDLTADEQQARNKFFQRAQLQKLTRNYSRNRLMSGEISFNEISDLEGNFSNTENIRRFGGLFRGIDTQGEETQGIDTFDELTDLDNEIGMLKALSLFQNEYGDKQ